MYSYVRRVFSRVLTIFIALRILFLFDDHPSGLNVMLVFARFFALSGLLVLRKFLRKAARESPLLMVRNSYNYGPIMRQLRVSTLNK